MREIRFRWDERKNRANRRKHGVSFEEASSVFTDDWALLLEDPDRAEDEDRFILLGMSSKLRLLLVCHSYRSRDEIIRLISARKATRVEQVEYTRRRRR